VSVVVSDTSPIRVLAHLGLLDLLPTIFSNVYIPPGDVNELENPHSHFPPISVSSISFLHIQSPFDDAKVQYLRTLIDAGESEALALALELHADAVLIDENMGRKIALELGLAPLGVLGVLLKAKRQKLIESVTALIDRLQSEMNFFISPSLRQEIIRQAGE
jgi:uncharacterized protein